MDSHQSSKDGNKLSTKHQLFIQSQNSCPLCGCRLEIRVMTYLEDYMLREEAHCPNCEVMARVKDHKMH